MKEAKDFKFVFVVFLCNKIEINQLQCVICRFLGNYDRITSDALEKPNRNGKKPKQFNFSN